MKVVEKGWFLMRKNWGLIGALILVLLVAWFAVINSDPVEINFFGFASVDWPLSIVILASLLIGALIAVLVASATAFSRHREVKGNEEKLQTDRENLEKERERFNEERIGTESQTLQTSQNIDEVEEGPRSRSDRTRHGWD